MQAAISIGCDCKVSYLMGGIGISIDIVRVDVEGHQAKCFEGGGVHCTRKK